MKLIAAMAAVALTAAAYAETQIYQDRADKYPIPIRVRVEINGKAIATPKGKRKDEQ